MQLRHIGLICGILACSYWVSGQKPLAKIPATYPNKIQCFTMGDSLLLLYVENTTESAQQIARWVMSDGNTKQIFLPQIKRPFINTAKFDSTHFLYFLEGTRKQVSLAAVRFNQGSTSGSRPADEVAVKGTFVGSFNDRLFNLVTYEDDTEDFYFYSFNGMQLKDTRKIHVPKAHYYYVNNRIQFFDSPRVSQASMGIGQLKLIREGKKFYVCADNADKEITSVTTYNLDDLSSTTASIEHQETNPLTGFRGWTSFPCNGMLYVGYVSNRVMDVSVYDLNGGRFIHQSTIDMPTTVGKKSIARDGDSRKVAVGKFLYSGKPAMLAAVERGVTRIRLGSYESSSRPVVPVPMGGLTQGFVTALVVAAITASDGDTRSHYVYLNEIPAHEGMKLPADSSEKCKAQQVDEYELNLEKRPKSKTYSKTGERAICIYETDHTIEVVEF